MVGCRLKGKSRLHIEKTGKVQDSGCVLNIIRMACDVDDLLLKRGKWGHVNFHMKPRKLNRKLFEKRGGFSFHNILFPKRMIPENKGFSQERGMAYGTIALTLKPLVTLTLALGL